MRFGVKNNQKKAHFILNKAGFFNLSSVLGGRFTSTSPVASDLILYSLESMSIGLLIYAVLTECVRGVVCFLCGLCQSLGAISCSATTKLSI